MGRFLQNSFGTDKQSLDYNAMIVGKKRKTVVGTFFELLVLKSRDIIDVKQDEPYGRIIITKAPDFGSILA